MDRTRETPHRSEHVGGPVNAGDPGDRAPCALQHREQMMRTGWCAGRQGPAGRTYPPSQSVSIRYRGWQASRRMTSCSQDSFP